MKFNQFGQPIGHAIQQPIPGKFKAQSLIGNDVNLVLIEQDRVALKNVEQLWDCIKTEPDERCWTYLPYEAPETFRQLEYNLKRNFGFEPSFHYWIMVEGQAVGWIALMNLREQHAAVEIGNVYFSHRLKQTAAATEVIYLLLNHCFEQGLRRIEWKCDDLNGPSKRAALRFGFVYEGLFRQDRVSKGRNRDTTWFSIIDSEWASLKTAYLQWLNPDNFNHAGKQKKRLEDFIVT
ncbi:RimJ/RimL family protein N-acetyltransferase [Acinetobacter baylyi]|uniref:RimJ/RimL family protein N-acetyltransferase n=1 Tax=Acinetobacter baylyi TaxID=202950 RepID=A0ABU0UV13_ACIBI|nr:GNAT family protein [Acinetobacter baylyi]MDQ1208385.1 RimJ/RimL family protein N-acetyltransferase [Acinetobacter baylyi]MDR6108025.1 RimJ/RimL family protein N-acetyltransferase [Acinetobacter baylyi]MDR6185259.1 RimJ/RimL family protein N-acetyltransferase [Acinetobacter baylyi]